jgi:hypothetical protein
MKTLCYLFLFYCGLLISNSCGKSIGSPIGNYFRKIEIQSDNPVEIVNKIYSQYPDKMGKISIGPGKFNTKRFIFEEIPIGIALQRVCDEFGLDLKYTEAEDGLDIRMEIRADPSNISSHFIKIPVKLQESLWKAETSFKEWLAKGGIQLDGQMDVLYFEKGGLYEIRTTTSEWNLVKALLVLTERGYNITSQKVVPK